MIGLNIGSGQRPFKSTEEIQWINIDSQEKWKPDLLWDASQLPYKTNAVEYVVLHHVCEHFQCGEAAGLIKEAQRVLKPRGSLLVFVPDLRALAIRWLEGGLSTQIYLTNVYGAYMGSPEDTHKWGFDPEYLNDFLWNSARWHAMKPFDWRGIPGADIAQDFWIIGAECVK